MTSGYDSHRLDELLQRLFDEVHTPADSAEINSALRDSADARDHYRKAVRVHAALLRFGQSRDSMPVVMPRRNARPIVVLAAAAAVMIGLLVIYQANRHPVAVLSGSTAAVWSGPSAGSSDLSEKSLSLASGFAEIAFHSGVRVIIQGPCQFKVTSPDSMDVAHGRATVKVPHHLNGFHLDTPAGRITDLGTEFGVAVGSGSEGPVVLTEVFDGEIEIPAEQTPRKRMQSGESLAIVRETGGTRLVSTLGDYRVNLGDSARHLPGRSDRAASPGNLALGKPVSSTGFYAVGHGSVFPAGSLTDGRLNDTGSPGDWSFWLAPNEKSGEFTVDLERSATIGRIDLQNTRNRTYGDRGLRQISLMVSADNLVFREILRAELRNIPTLPEPGVDFPFESFSFEPVEARYVKVVGLTHYQKPERPLEDPNKGGGLNEIRIFAP